MSKRKKLYLLFGGIFLILLIIVCSIHLLNKKIPVAEDFLQNTFLVNKIAHAGGEIEGKIYTNSLEALNSSLEKGFVYFEIDFMFTSDEYLICLHDWGSTFNSIFGFSIKNKINLSEFNRLINLQSGIHPCTLETLIIWMKNNPNTYIITDIKEDNIKALEIISKNVPEFEKRIIPQIYSPKEFKIVKDMGYEQIIWTLYRYWGTNQMVLSAIKNFEGSFAITMTKIRARLGLSKKLAKLNIPTYTHSVNSLKEEKMFLEKYNISEVYTYFLVR